MHKTLTLLQTFGFCALGLSTFGAEHPELKVYPVAKEGMDRFVIVLPQKERGEEKDLMVELLTGKVMWTDGINLMGLDNAIEQRTVEGWGYSYYEVTGSSALRSTIMMPEGGRPMVQQFVSGFRLKIRYNSRLPIVVYAPKGYEVRYRIWQASETTETAETG